MPKHGLHLIERSYCSASNFRPGSFDMFVELGDANLA